MNIGAGPFTVDNFCPSSSGAFADFSIDPVSFCIFYQGVNSVGTDSMCVEVCGSTACDTTFLFVTVLPETPVNNAFLFENVFVNQNASFCPSPSTGSGNIVNISNMCPTMSGNSVIFTPNQFTNCIDYTAFDVGSDTACVVIEDDLGNFDTISLVINVLAPQPEVILDTIILGNSMDFCLDTSELAGTTNQLDNFCDTLSGNSVDFQLNALTLCIEAQSLNVGTETACIEFCDDFGICDTATYIITVLDPSMSPPVAFNDVDTTSQNQPTGLDYCENDIIPDGNITSFGFLDIADGGVGPTNGGTVVFSPDDCFVNYVPQSGFCGGVDSFSYTICNAVGCDTAIVAVYVECPPGTGEFEIHNAFSPNGDDINDSFVIDGLDNFVDHELCVYNRWGSLVLRTENYQNDWEGTWEGNDLPSGTYFYVFDDGNGNILSGSVQIRR